MRPSQLSSGSNCQFNVAASRSSCVEVRNSFGLAAELGIAGGTRVEIRWLLSDEAGQESKVWWGASVLEHAEADGTWHIEYDAREGFEAEEAQVDFLSKSALRDLGSGDILKWRKQGCAEEASDEEGDEIVNLGQLSAEQDALDRAVGPLDAHAAAALAAMPAAQAAALAAGMRDFTDHILASLRAKAPGATVTEQDVRSMLSDFRRRAA
ncbi:hypothetical protein WJX81_004696 [Elliptochloris bilobata]|uniref:Uncharacterized protein n=1 Tax=Elliptochloris bilobata TaxID=381761 RepID=A0AAW1SCA3_9CHLO